MECFIKEEHSRTVLIIFKYLHNGNWVLLFYVTSETISSDHIISFILYRSKE